MFGLNPVWVWAIIGIVLIIIEMVSVTFFFAFIGMGALITALAVYLGVKTISIQIIIFCLTSILMVALFRKTAKKLFAGHSDMKPDYVDEKVEVIEDILPGRDGSVKYRGSKWIAYSEDLKIIPAGTIVKVIASEGIKLKVEK